MIQKSPNQSTLFLNLELAKRQLRDYRSFNPGTCFADPEFSIDAKTAYYLQDTVTQLRVGYGESVIGYKVGCTGPGTTAQFGMDGPIRGTLFAEEVLQTGFFFEPKHLLPTRSRR